MDHVGGSLFTARLTGGLMMVYGAEVVTDDRFSYSIDAG
jgi:hypothetical protein